ncbi:type II secretion system F family protein (plasmid) [Pontibacillus sp. ALD_SL1]|uniref:type II secretion system F family protein n=1 Tax=Pontibacillus sp. ALD_SL1 TaxID=2777185 RepID=UPI001A97219E|nr:type II secretion system F family protein [Pontibacillus sp. ALD_SL1]QST02979.1 type II secretion system F family protein [Pontibacillus sp. ALD_SL1]
MDALIARIGDGFSQHPFSFIYLVVCITVLALLTYDLRLFKTNQVTRQVTARIGKGDKDNKFSIIDLVSLLFSKQEEKIKTQLLKANILLEPKEYLSFMSIGAIVGSLIGFLLYPIPGLWSSLFFWIPVDSVSLALGRFLAAGVLGFLGTLAPKLIVMVKIQKRYKLLQDQIQDALLNIADALKSGHIIQKAIQIVGKDMPYPIGEEFSKTHNEMDAGKSFKKAMKELKRRIDIKDFTMAINAMEIQYEVGGKLEPLLRNMSKIIQQRQELKKEIDKTIANSKMVGIILLSAPIFFAITFTLLNKEQYAVMITTLVGQILLVVAALSYIAAAALIIWIIRGVSKDI